MGRITTGVSAICFAKNSIASMIISKIEPIGIIIESISPLNIFAIMKYILVTIYLVTSIITLLLEYKKENEENRIVQNAQIEELENQV